MCLKQRGLFLYIFIWVPLPSIVTFDKLSFPRETLTVGPWTLVHCEPPDMRVFSRARPMRFTRRKIHSASSRRWWRTWRAYRRQWRQWRQWRRRLRLWIRLWRRRLRLWLRRVWLRRVWIWVRWSRSGATPDVDVRNGRRSLKAKVNRNSS